MEHEENKDSAAVVPLLGQFGRSLSNLFSCATPGQVIVLSIDDITNGLDDEVEYLLDGNKRGGPVAMLKWAKGSKNGGHNSSTGHHSGSSAARVSLADLRRASAKLLRRKDSSSITKSKNSPTSAATTRGSSPHDIKTGTTTSSDGGGRSPPPPMVPPRGSSAASCHGIPSSYGYSGGSVISAATTPCSVRSASQKAGVIKHATVRRMSTLRQARSVSPVKDRVQQRRPDSTSSCTTNSSCSSSITSRRTKRKPTAVVDTFGDNGSSLYMQLDKIPVAVQQTAGASSSVYMSTAAANLKRKALEDISNQAYRNIINSLQDELAQMSDAEAEAARSASADETRTLAEATLLPMNRMEITRSSTIRNPTPKEIDPVIQQVSPSPSIKYQHQRSTSQPMPLKKLDGVVASFTNQPPASSDLHRPRPVRHPPSPTANESGDNLMDLSSLALACSRNGLPSTPTPSSACHPFNGTSSPLKKSAPIGPHTLTGQHLHQYGPARSLVSHGLSISNATGCQDSSNQNPKKNRPNKQVTFQTEARLIGNESITLPVVFESEREGSQTNETKEPGPLEMPGFVNIPCSRRGFCLELDSANDLPDVAKLNESCGSSSEQTTTDEVDHVKRVMSPDGGYDWQPSYVNLEDTEIAPVLLASSRPADDSSDFWKPRSVASGGRQQQKQQQQQQQQLVEPLQPVYDAPNNNNNKSIDVDNPLLLEFPGFRYAMMQLPGNNALMERRSISNGSSGSDTQDSGVAEMAQALSLSRAASASPQLAASRQSLAEDMLLPVQPFVYNTLPRTDNKRSLYYNCWSNQSQQQQPQQQQSMPLPSCPSSVYSTTDPHFLSALASPFFSRRMPEEKAQASSSSSSTLMANVDQQDSSWSSDHLYCNMASVDPLPSLPPRISRRCHSLLALASTKTTTTTGEAEDADYENLNMPSQPGQPVMAFKARLNVSHSRSRSLRHSGDFTSPFGWMIPPFQQQQQSKTKEQEKRNELLEEMETKVIDNKEDIYKRTSSRPVSSRRQQMLHERAHRLELMLNDASVNDCSELYEPSDWSMEAMLSDTVRDMDNLSFMDGPQQQTSRNHCQHCCCTSSRRPAPPPMHQCRCQMTAYPSHSPSSSSSASSARSCQCSRKKKSSGRRESIRIRENAATQTDLQNAGLASASLRLANRATAAENPLYMAYSDLTKINCDDLDRSAKNAATNTTPGTVGQMIGDDYASDSCETWNSHKALYARLQAAKQSREVTTLMETTPLKKRNNNKGRHHHNNKPLSTPSGSRIWRHEGQSVSTPQKNRRDGGRRRHNRRRGYSTVNTTANSSKMDQTAMSTRSTYSTKGSNNIRRRKSSRRPKAADVLHGKGQLQLAIYLNSGLLTIHVQSARYLKSNSGRPCNSYVKVSLIPDSPEQTFCRTTLVKNDNNPWYDQKFSFEFLSADLYKRLFISVWDRDAKKNRSDFRGCMSFSVSHVIRKDASGWYRLLNGNVGRQRHFAVKKQIDLNNSTIVPTDPDMEEDLVVVDDSDLDNRTVEEHQDRVTLGVPSSPSSSSTGSKMTGTDARPTRCSAPEMEPKGKTPYTTTVNLKRGPKGYGFSVTWTHPPRIERVEPGLAADLAGMRVADYIVFVGSHNVVKMDEEQVLQLIQSAGDTLTLEIYRKNGNKPSGSVTSDQLTTTELHSGNIQQRQLKSPVNQSYHHSSSISMANTSRMPVVSHHQQPSAVAVASSSAGIAASSNSRRVVVESVGHVSRYPNINNVNNTAAQQLGINISNAPPPLKVAFNKSIGGGVLV